MSTNTLNNMPHNWESETNVICAMLSGKDKIAQAMEQLEDNHFYDAKNKLFFQTIAKMFENNEVVTYFTFRAKLETTGYLGLLSEDLANDIFSRVDFYTNTNLTEFISKIKSSFREREILLRIKTIEESIINKGYEGDVYDFAEQMIFSLTKSNNTATLTKTENTLPYTIQEIKDISEGLIQTPIISTGFRDLDNVIGGFRKSQLIILGAQTSIGKTSFALAIAYHIAVRQSKTVLFVSHEMTHEELNQRLISAYANINLSDIIKGFNIYPERQERMDELCQSFQKKNLYVEDGGRSTIPSIKAKTRRVMLEAGGIDLIIIDYLTQIDGNKNKTSKHHEVTEITRELKNLAKELKIPVIVLAQLNRLIDSRTKKEKKPKLSDLRESGSIEQDADVVLFLANSEHGDDIKELIVAKNRHGAKASVNLKFTPALTKFEDIN